MHFLFNSVFCRRRFLYTRPLQRRVTVLPHFGLFGTHFMYLSFFPFIFESHVAFFKNTTIYTVRTLTAIFSIKYSIIYAILLPMSSNIKLR